jgi:hypothetical protein
MYIYFRAIYQSAMAYFYLFTRAHASTRLPHTTSSPFIQQLSLAKNFDALFTRCAHHFLALGATLGTLFARKLQLLITFSIRLAASREDCKKLMRPRA